VTEWLVLDGPLKGQWRTASELAMRVLRPASPNQAVYPDSADIIYYPRRLRVPGWRVLLRVWAIEATLEMGVVLPGKIKGAPVMAEPTCPVCYGRTLPPLETCSRIECITTWSSIRAMYSYLGDRGGWA
jgi:hypothetical protein